jgi:hypothetical protein
VVEPGTFGVEGALPEYVLYLTWPVGQWESEAKTTAVNMNRAELPTST